MKTKLFFLVSLLIIVFMAAGCGDVIEFFFPFMQDSEEKEIEERERLMSSDADNDGLSYWQETQQYNTDPDDPDTDDDGMSDGDEVSAGRDPLIPDGDASETTTRGNAEEETEDREEPELPAGPVQPEENKYVSVECGFSFTLPEGWMIQSENFYETAGGSKAKQPMIIIVKSNDPQKTISINAPQAHCMQVDPYTTKNEPAGSQTMTVYTYLDATDNSEIGGCLTAEAPGKDINGNATTYRFVSQFKDQATYSAFKQIVGSFK